MMFDFKESFALLYITYSHILVKAVSNEIDLVLDLRIFNIFILWFNFIILKSFWEYSYCH